MKTASVAIATMVLAATATVALAEQAKDTTAPARSQKMMARLDADKDGRITKEEAEAARKKMFARLDRNSDGVIDEQEIDRARKAIMDRATMMETRLSMQWQRLDKDGDGKVSADEFEARTGMFDLADRNGDGVVTADEIEALRAVFGRPGKAG